MYWLATKLGRLTARLTRRLGKGHGSALPGLVAEKLDHNYLSKLLGDLSRGVVLVSGTNGKTTTTKIVADLLTADGYKVFTNPSGSNFTRGVISAALPLTKHGRLEADVAVLELDEAYATKFVEQVRPRYALLLNVLRDQLDRFGEIDHTAELLQCVAEHTTGTVILNEDDPRLNKFASDKKAKAAKAWFGVDGAAAANYATDEEIHGKKKRVKKQPHDGAVELTELDDNRATYEVGGKDYAVKLKLFGIHNALNCAAALATVRAVEGQDFDAKRVMQHLAGVTPAFGRGEIITIGDVEIRLVLVKNPSGFQLALNSSRDVPTLIAINDAYADGRDVSWLWDVSFPQWRSPIYLAGRRGYDMMLRLYYAGFPFDQIYHEKGSFASHDIDTTALNLSDNVMNFYSELKRGGGRGQIFATYTAMLELRDLLEVGAMTATEQKGATK